MPRIAQRFICLNSGTLYPLSTISCSPSKRKSSGKLQSILTWTCLMPKPPPSYPPALKTQKTEQWIINWGVSSGAPRLVPARLSLLNRFPRKAFNFFKGFPELNPGYPHVHSQQTDQRGELGDFPLWQINSMWITVSCPYSWAGPRWGLTHHVPPGQNR